jgi:hypothetical protein
MVPNSVVLNMAVTPLSEPDSVELLARLPAQTRPSSVQDVLDATVHVDTLTRPDVELQEVDGDEVVVRISATPERSSDGAQLADEILTAVARFTRNGHSSGAHRDRDRSASAPVEDDAGFRSDG